MNRRFISIALVLLWMGCITTQTTEQHGTCDELVKELKNKSCQIPVDGVWDEWTETSKCSVTCGGGNKTYSRKCIQPRNGGTKCEGDASKLGNCGEQKCPGTLKQCDLVPVDRNARIPWNPDSQTITFTTNGEAGSGEWMGLLFKDKDGDYAGGLIIRFYEDIKYYIGSCSSDTPFPATLPRETERTWTITYNYMEKRVVIGCNEVQEVLNFVLSDRECSNRSWKEKWDTKPTQIQFYSYETASDAYCISSNTVVN